MKTREMDDVRLRDALAEHVQSVDALSASCSSMATVPLKMFDRGVTLVAFEVVHGDSYKASYVKAIYRFAGERFEISQHFGDSPNSDPWMGEGRMKRARLLRWILESIRRFPNTSSTRPSYPGGPVDP